MSLFASGGPTSPQRCERYADELILLDEPGPETPGRIAARAHLAECQRCQQDRAAMLAASSALRGHVRALMAQAPAFTEAEIAARAAQPARASETTPQSSRSQLKASSALGGQSAPARVRPASPFLRRALSAGGSVAAAALITGLLVATLTGHLPGRSPSTGHRLVAPRATAVPLSALTVYAPAPQMGAVGAQGLAAYRASDGALESRTPVAPVAQWGTVSAQDVRYQLTMPNANISDPTVTVPAILSATRIRDGQTLWTERIDPIFTPDLVLVNGVLYLGAQFVGVPGVDTHIKAIYAYRASDGARLWRRSLPAHLDGPPVVSQGVVYVVAGETAFALRADDGGILWQTALRTGGLQIVSAWQTAASGALYVYASLVSPTGQKDAFGVDVFALRVADGGALWRVELGTDIFPAAGPFPPVVADGVVYVRLATVKFTSPITTLQLFALRATDGSTLWRYTSQRGETGNMGIPNIYPPAVTNGAVYVTEDGGALTALAASDGHVIWRVHVDPAPGSDVYPFSISSPAAVDGAVFVAGNGWLVAVRASDGGTMWRASCGTLDAPMNYQPYHLVVGP